MAKKWVYAFEEGDGSMRNLLGGKGANLAEMTNIGLPVPPGFTITTEACIDYLHTGEIPRRYVGSGSQVPGRTRQEDRQAFRRTTTIRCWFRSGRARVNRCPA